MSRNEKVPLTSIEKTVLGLDEGPATGDAARANAAGIEIAGFHLGFATSLPAFQFGYDFAAKPADLAPCADLSVSYMSCMDALGVDRSEEHTSELQSLMRISYAVFCLKKKINQITATQ